MSDDVTSIDDHRLLSESDWDDDDLLSIAEASNRIETEIAVLRASLAQQPDGSSPDKVINRLNALERVLESINQGPSPLAAVSPDGWDETVV
jgi:hypothetical protein